MTYGSRFNSSIVKISGRSTMPWIISRCSLRIDLRDERAAVRGHVEQRRGRDDADRILQRRDHVKRQAEMSGECVPATGTRIDVTNRERSP